MENFLWQVEPILQQGRFFYPFPGDFPIPMVATHNIGVVAAQWLLQQDWSGQEGIGVDEPEDLSLNQVAVQMSEAINQTVRFQPVSPEAYTESMLQHGASPAYAPGLLDMFAEVAAGIYHAEAGCKLGKLVTSYKGYAFTAMHKTSQIIRILAISGSLRRVSSNTALLQAAIALAPATVEIKLYDGLGSLPHFNPDLEPTEPLSVTDLRTQIRWADGLLISTPEYAHGVPGVLKNALDWLVSGSEFIGKPIALLNASPRATYAQSSLTEIVTVMTGRIVLEASITVPLLGRNIDIDGIVADLELSQALQRAVMTFVDAIYQFQTEAAFSDEPLR